MTSDAKGKLSDAISALITIRKSAEQVLFWQILVQSNSLTIKALSAQKNVKNVWYTHHRNAKNTRIT